MSKSSNLTIGMNVLQICKKNPDSLGAQVPETFRSACYTSTLSYVQILLQDHTETLIPAIKRLALLVL